MSDIDNVVNIDTAREPKELRPILKSEVEAWLRGETVDLSTPSEYKKGGSDER